MKYSPKKTLLLDFEYLTGNNDEIIVKEVSIMHAHSVVPYSFILLPPYPLKDLYEKTKKKVNFQKEFGHQITWDYGTEPHTYFRDVLNKMNNSDQIEAVIVNGREKLDIVKAYCDRATDLGITKLYETYQPFEHNCSYHSSTFIRCSSHHVTQLLMFMIENNMFK